MLGHKYYILINLFPPPCKTTIDIIIVISG